MGEWGAGASCWKVKQFGIPGGRQDLIGKFSTQSWSYRGHVAPLETIPETETERRVKARFSGVLVMRFSLGKKKISPVCTV